MCQSVFYGLKYPSQTGEGEMFPEQHTSHEERLVTAEILEQKLHICVICNWDDLPL